MGSASQQRIFDVWKEKVIDLRVDWIGFIRRLCAYSKLMTEAHLSGVVVHLHEKCFL